MYTRLISVSPQPPGTVHSNQLTHARERGNVTVMAPGFAQSLFLLSPALHWAVLINTNGWYGCEELRSRRYKRVHIATNFASRLRSHRTDSEPPFTPNKPGIYGTTSYTVAFTDLLYLLDLERSQKVDLGTCRSQGPIRSLRLEGKG